MAKKDKSAPQTLNQRQASFRQTKTADGFGELHVWVKTETRERLKAEAIAQGITIGERIDQLIKD